MLASSSLLGWPKSIDDSLVLGDVAVYVTAGATASLAAAGGDSSVVVDAPLLAGDGSSRVGRSDRDCGL